MKNRIFAVILLLVLVISVGGCNKATVSNSTGTSSTSQSGTTVLLENYSFKPAVLTVDAGTTVEWKNNDNVIHTVEFESFKSGPLTKGATYKHTFDEKGTFDYNCGPHPYMKGKIEVK